jgi:hypothetical protein
MNEGNPAAEPTEEELRAAYEEQIKQIRVEQIVLENVVTLLNLGMRRAGLAPGTEDERDPDQVRVAIDSVRAVLPLLEQTAPEHLRQVRDALSQLQMAYVRIGGQETAPGGGGGPSPPGGEGSGAAGGTVPPAPGGMGEPGAPPNKSEDPGPAQRSGRLWVPGQ